MWNIIAWRYNLRRMKKSRKSELGFGLIVPGGGALVLGWTGTWAPYVFNIATFPGLGRNLLRLKGFFLVSWWAWGWWWSLKLMLDFSSGWESLLTTLGREGGKVVISWSEGMRATLTRHDHKSSPSFAVPSLHPGQVSGYSTDSSSKGKALSNILPGWRVQMVVFCNSSRITSSCTGQLRHFPKLVWQAWDHTQTTCVKGWCIRMRRKPFNPVESPCFGVPVLQQEQRGCVTWCLVAISQILKWVC